MATLVIKNKLDNKELERHDISMSLIDWVKINCPSYDPDAKVFSATKNGKSFDYSEPLHELDFVELFIEPKDPATIALVAITIASTAYSYYVTKNLDLDQNYQRSSEPGKSIYSPSARANTLDPNGIIREQAGSIKSFPSYIIPPYRRFIDNEEHVYLFMSVGVGYYDLLPEMVYIAETQALSYGDAIEMAIYEPGDDVTDFESHEFWYTSREIKNIKLENANKNEGDGWTSDFSGDTITSKLNGEAAGFPYAVGSYFKIDSDEPSVNGYYRVESLSGSVKQTATVVTASQQEAADQNSQLAVNIPRVGGRPSAPLRDMIVLPGRGPGNRPSRNYVEPGSSPSFPTLNDVEMDWEANASDPIVFGPYTIAPEGELTDELELDFKFSNGLGKYNSNGDLVNHTVTVLVKYREFGVKQWLTKRFSWTDATRDELGFSVRLPLGAQTGPPQLIGQKSAIYPEIEVSRETPDAVDSTTFDVVSLLSVKCKLSAQGKYPDVTTLGVILRGTNNVVNGSENDINIRGATRKLPTLSEFQSLNWDLSASNTANNNFFNISDTKFVHAQNFDKVVDGITLDHATPSFDISRSGKRIFIETARQVVSGQISDTYYTYFSVERMLQSHQINTIGLLAQNRTLNDLSNIHGFVPRVQRLGHDVHERYYITLSESPAATTPFIYARNYFDHKTIIGSASLNLSGLPQDVYSVGDGVQFFIAMDSIIYKFTTNTAWSFSSATQVGSFNFTSQTSKDIKSIYLSEDGAKMFVLADDNWLYEYNLSPSFTLTSVTVVRSTGQYQTQNPIKISVYDKHLYMNEKEGDSVVVNQYDINYQTDTGKTRNPVRFAAYVLWSILGSQVFNKVDWAKMSELESSADANGETLDAEFVDETTAWEALKPILATCFSEPTASLGKFKPVRAPESFNVSSATEDYHVYTPDVIKSEVTFNQSTYLSTEPDGIEVEYFDSETGQTETILCPDNTVLRPHRIQAIGITGRNNAWRFGMLEHNRRRYKPGTMTFSTELDALNSFYGDPILVPTGLWGGDVNEIVAQSGDELTLKFEKPASHDYVIIRNQDGKALYRSIIFTQGDKVITVSPTLGAWQATIDDPIQDPSYVVTGNTANVNYRRGIVRAIRPSDETTVELIAEQYKDEVYGDISANHTFKNYVVPNQIIQMEENRQSGALVGTINIGGGSEDDDILYYFDNGTTTSDDGYFEISGNKILITSAGSSSSLNDYNPLGNNSYFYSIYLDSTDSSKGKSDNEIVTIRTTETLFPPVSSVLYFAVEWGNTGNLVEDLPLNGISPTTQLFDVDGLANYGASITGINGQVYTIGAKYPYDNSQERDYLEIEGGTLWFFVEGDFQFDVRLFTQTYQNGKKWMTLSVPDTGQAEISMSTSDTISPGGEDFRAEYSSHSFAGRKLIVLTKTDTVNSIYKLTISDGSTTTTFPYTITSGAEQDVWIKEVLDGGSDADPTTTTTGQTTINLGNGLFWDNVSLGGSSNLPSPAFNNNNKLISWGAVELSMTDDNVTSLVGYVFDT